MLDFSNLINRLIAEEYRQKEYQQWIENYQLRIDNWIRDINDKISVILSELKQNKSSGIDSYEDRVAFTAGIIYPNARVTFKINTTFNAKITDNRHKILEWLSWFEEERVSLHDVWVYIFKCMDDDELISWHNRYNELINDLCPGNQLVEELKSIIDISIAVGSNSSKE